MGLLDMLSGAPAWLGHEAMQGGRWLGHEAGGLFGQLPPPGQAAPQSKLAAPPAGTMPAPVQSPPPAAPVKTVPSRPSWLRIAGDVLAPNLMGAYDHERARMDQTEQQQRFSDLADQLNLSPREKLVFMASPEEWAKQNASRYGYHDAPGGSTVVNAPAGSTQVAPMLHAFGDRFGVATIDPQNGQPVAQYSAPRAPTFDEQSLDAQRRAEAATAMQRDLEAARHNRADEGLGGGRLKVEQQRAAKAAAGGANAGLPAGFVVEKTP